MLPGNPWKVNFHWLVSRTSGSGLTSEADRKKLLHSISRTLSSSIWWESDRTESGLENGVNTLN